LKVLAGGWAHFDRFDDVGEGRRHSGNYALYAIADARLSRSGRRLLRAFVRASASPSDRNPVDLYADAGITLTAPLRSRPDDSVGLAFGIARISPSLISLVRRQIALSGGSAKVPHAEAVVELTYQLKLRSRAYLQPDVQWIAHPAGWLLGGTPAAHPPKAHALIVGLRSSLVF
jgi:porin